MIYKGLELFNVTEIEETETGVKLYRFPKSVCESIRIPLYDNQGKEVGYNTDYRQQAKWGSGIEIRFVTDATRVTVKLKSEIPQLVYAYNGDFSNNAINNSYYHYAACLKGNETTEFTLVTHPRLVGVGERSNYRFDKQVWRIYLGNLTNFELVSVEADGTLQPPAPSQVPAIKMLAYGSSITQGYGTPFAPLNYINTAGYMLGIDVLNKGIGGGCFCDREMLDYLVQEQFDYGYFELGTNLATQPDALIEERLGHFIDTMCAMKPHTPLFFMTPIKGVCDVSATTESMNYECTRRIIKEHASKFSNALLLDGHALLHRDCYLSADILHPSEFGHVMMGMQLHDMLKEYIPTKSKIL